MHLIGNFRFSSGFWVETLLRNNLFLFLPDPQLMKFDIKEDHLMSAERLCWNIFQHGFEIEYLHVQVHLVYTNQPITFFLKRSFSNST